MFGHVTYYDAAPGWHPDRVAVGHIYAAQPTYLPAPFGVRLSNLADDAPDMELTRHRAQDLFLHAHCRGLGLPPGEALVVAKAKWDRPVVVLGEPGTELLARRDKARRTDNFVCAPIYGADQFSAGHVRRVAAYAYPNLFYLPASVSPAFDEGFVRLDHLQAIARQHLRQRRAAMLSAEALELLRHWLMNYLGGGLPATSPIARYREQAMAALDERAGN